jgi:PST family polysaccharide transporter
LGRRAAHGFAWLIAQTIGVKGVSLIANVVLAWFLMPDEAGLVGMAYTVLSIAGFVQYVGMQDVLVQRQARMRRWVNAAFWMLLTVGVIGGTLVALAAPVAARVYDQPKLVGLVLLLAVASPLQTVQAVPQAILASQLRFRTVVLIGTASAIGVSVLSILFAMLGFGAYSFLAPVPIIALLQLIALWRAARPPVRPDPQFRRWRLLIGDTSYTWGVSICTIIITTADHVVLSLLFPPAVVGIYFWAVNLSTQLHRLLASNLTNVLLPSLSRLHGDPERQAWAFVHAMRLLAMIGIPACLLQAALARPLVSILYKDDWLAVGGVLAVLSIGMAFHFVSGPATSIMKARGAFRQVFVLHAVHAALMTATVIAIALRSNESNAALNMAIGTAGWLAAFGPVYLLFAIRSALHGWRAPLRIYGPPTTAGALAIGAAIGVDRLIPAMSGRDFIQIGVTTVTALILYPALIRLIDPDLWRIATARVAAGLSRGAARPAESDA